MGPEPEFCCSILFREIDKSGVGNDYEWAFGMAKPSIFVYWLAKTIGTFQGVVACRSYPFWFITKIAMISLESVRRFLKFVIDLRIHHLDNEGIEEEVIMKELRFRERCAL